MEDEQTNKADTKGATDNKPAEDDKKDISELDKLKSSNDEFEKELIRGREMQAEAQKIEANKMLGGTAGGHVEVEKKEETPGEYKDKVMRGDLNA